MISRFFLIASLAIVASEAGAAPMSMADRSVSGGSLYETVRLVCDQDCRCWHTAYREKAYPRKAEIIAVDDVNACPAGGRYNGHYRSGPSVGLGFESRIPNKSLFPFF